MSSENYETNDLRQFGGFARHLAQNCMLHILQEVGAEMKVSE